MRPKEQREEGDKEAGDSRVQAQVEATTTPNPPFAWAGSAPPTQGHRVQLSEDAAGSLAACALHPLPLSSQAEGSHASARAHQAIKPVHPLLEDASSILTRMCHLPVCSELTARGWAGKRGLEAGTTWQQLRALQS